MGNTSAKEPSMFARLMTKRGHADEKQWMAFSKRMSKLDTVWPENGAQTTKFLRGLVERQKGRVNASDQVFLQHIETLVQERDAKAHAQATRAAARLAQNKRPSAVLRKGNANVYDTSSMSEKTIVHLHLVMPCNHAHASHAVIENDERAVGSDSPKYDSVDPGWAGGYVGRNARRQAPVRANMTASAAYHAVPGYDCRSQSNSQPKPPPPPLSLSECKGDVCFSCRQRGHFKRTCPNRRVGRPARGRSRTLPGVLIK